MKIKGLIYIHGLDNIGWSIDEDNKSIKEALSEKIMTKNIIKADIIYSTWWNNFFSIRNYFYRFKKNIFVTCSNFIDLNDKNYKLINKFIEAEKYVSLWIAPSKKQYKILKERKLRVEYLPFYVNENMFFKLNVSKKNICSKLDINFNKIKGKKLIGSFQRDSLGSNLNKGKWQKNPDGLINILKDYENKNDFTLILAGPRRHYIINQCKKFKINYLFVGDESYINKNLDDNISNNLTSEKINYLYNLIDIYIVSSVSEGGPKSILESCWSRTFIISTDVGLASDFLDNDFIYNNKDEAIIILDKVLENKINLKTIVYRNYLNIKDKNSFVVYKDNLRKIINNYINNA